jgi:hypothetical protein
MYSKPRYQDRLLVHLWLVGQPSPGCQWPFVRHDSEAIITVRGERKYVVVDFNTYNKLREYELDIALQEARADVKQGRVKKESIDEHMKRILD